AQALALLDLHPITPLAVQSDMDISLGFPIWVVHPTAIPRAPRSDYRTDRSRLPALPSSDNMGQLTGIGSVYRHDLSSGRQVDAGMESPRPPAELAGDTDCLDG